MNYIMLKKSCTVICLTPEVWEKILAQIIQTYPLPHKSQMGDHTGSGEEAGEFDTLVDVIRQQNGWSTLIMWWLLRL